jgi:hypothetical protein
MSNVSESYLPSLDGLGVDQLDDLVGRSALIDEAIARHPAVSGDTLARLARSASKSVVRAVMLNPACPKETLLANVSKYPREFFQNPVFILLLIEDPDLLLKLPVTATKSMLSDPECPAVMTSWALASNNSSFALALAKNEAASLDTLKTIARSHHVRASELALTRLMRMGVTLESDA